MTLEILLVVFVGVTAFAFILQSIAMWRAFQVIRETVEQLNTQSENIRRDIQDITHRIRQTSESLQPIGRMAEDVSTSFQDTARTMRERAEDFDRFLQELIQIAREQALKVDQVVTDTVEKFDQTTDVIKRDLIRPVLEMSSFLKGLRSGLGFLFRKDT